MIQDIIKYIDDLWITEQIWYRLSSKGIESKNISKFLKKQRDYSVLDEIIIEEGWHEIEDDDKVIYLVMKWVKNNIKYNSDNFNYKTSEYWADIIETLSKMSGDCEDGAILILLFGWKLGIEKERLKLWCGETKYGGHACAIYKSIKYPYVWFFMDWCMEPELIVPGLNRKAYIFSNDLSPTPFNNPYKKGWFVVDDEKGSKRLNW